MTVKDFSRFNKQNFIKLDMARPECHLATCLVCEETLRLQTKENFIPYSIWIDSGGKHARTLLIKSNKDALRRFTDTHYVLCVNPCRD